MDEYPEIDDSSSHPRLFSDMPDDQTTEALITLYQDGLLNAWWDEERERTQMQMTKKGRLATEFADAPGEVFEAVAQGYEPNPSAMRNLRGDDR